MFTSYAKYVICKYCLLLSILLKFFIISAKYRMSIQSIT